MKFVKDISECGSYREEKWYSKRIFPLIPHLVIQKANEQNTSSITLTWLCFTIWSLDTLSLEVSVVVDKHWGIGIIGILPYLRWAITFPIPHFITNIHEYLRRDPKIITEK